MTSQSPIDEQTGRLPLSHHALTEWQRWQWFQLLYDDVIQLVSRYRVRVDSRWWESSVAVEALAALAAWIDRYDTGEWDDPPGKLSLLYDLERVEILVRGDGGRRFNPAVDRTAFEDWIADKLAAERP